MKKKQLKKVSKYLFDQLEEHKAEIRKRKMYSETEAPTPMEEYSNWCEYDSDVSEKFKKLFYNVLKYPDGITIEFGDSYININSESVKRLKNTPNQATYNGSSKLSNKVSDEDYLRIEVSKVGFVLNYGYRKITRYKDDTMITQLLDDVKAKVKQINADNFNEIWENISKESGLLRDSNLDDIFKDVEV